MNNNNINVPMNSIPPVPPISFVPQQQQQQQNWTPMYNPTSQNNWAMQMVPPVSSQPSNYNTFMHAPTSTPLSWKATQILNQTPWWLLSITVGIVTFCILWHKNPKFVQGAKTKTLDNANNSTDPSSASNPPGPHTLKVTFWSAIASIVVLLIPMVWRLFITTPHIPQSNHLNQQMQMYTSNNNNMNNTNSNVASVNMPIIPSQTNTI